MSDPTDPLPPPRRGLRVTTLMVAVLVVGGGLGLGVRAFQQTRESARERQCMINLRQIGLAMYNYHESYGHFPPAYIADESGKPIHSWRMLIFPFLESSTFFNQYTFAEPWDGPRNRRLLDPIWPSFYHCPSRDAKQGLTSYVMVTGLGTAFPGAGTTRLSDIRDGADQTIMVVEVSNVDILWQEPRDLDIRELSGLINDPKRLGPSSPHTLGPAVLFADGHTIRLNPAQAASKLKAMLTIDGGEGVAPKNPR